MSRSALLSAAAVVSVTLALGAQAPSTSQGTFRAGVDIVEVEVSVLDEHRMPLRGLAAGDFTVLEDGKPRPIVAFTPVQLQPRQLPPARWMAEIAPDVQSNVFPREGRLIAILLDRSIPTELIPLGQKIAESAIEQLRPGDLAAVVWTSHGMPQNFTADRELLRAAIRQPFARLPLGDSGSAADCYCGACSLDHVSRIAEAVQDVRQRRKTLLYIGTRLAVHSTGVCSGVLEGLRERALRAAKVGNLTIYTFDPTGLETLGPSAATNRRPSTMASLRRRGDLMVLPDFTGGRSVFHNEPAAVLPEIFRESDAYYVLGFQPTHADGRFHNIQVKVARSDVTLQARRGYYASGAAAPRVAVRRDGLPPALFSAIEGVWPRTTIPLTLSAAPMAMPGLQRGVVAVVLGVRQDLNREGPGAVAAAPASPRQTSVDVLIGAFDRNGRMLARDRQTVSVMPRAAGAGTFTYEVISRLDLDPGRYELRAALEDSTLGETGSVYGYVDVPNYAAEHVALSGILLEASPSRATTVGMSLDTLVPLTPTARRDFSRSDQVTMFVKSYQGLTRNAMPGYVVTEILDDADRRVFRREQRVVIGDVGSNRAIDLSMDVPVKELAAGQYLLRVEARHGSDTATREVRFSVN